MGGFQEGGFQIAERAATSSRGNLLLQGNSYLKSTLRLLLRLRVWGQVCYLKYPPSENPPLDFPNKLSAGFPRKKDKQKTRSLRNDNKISRQ